MQRFQNPTYLRPDQYVNSSNLNARAELHRRFSTNPLGFPRWAYEQFSQYLDGRVLEAGGGPGWLWQDNAARLPRALRLCLSDLSPGMLREARGALEIHEQIAYTNLDVQAIPFPTASFRLIIANHMLYHVSDLPQAADELARVLADGGRLFAATNGRAHMHELAEWVRRVVPAFAVNLAQATQGFNLENAAARLSSAFPRVEVRRYPDSLWVTEARPLVDYVLSLSAAAEAITPDKAQELEALFLSKIQADGGIRLTKEAGLAVAALV